MDTSTNDLSNNTSGQILTGTFSFTMDTNATSTITGGSGDETLNGTSSNDIMTGGAGNNTLIGGAGTDTAVYTGNRNEFTIHDNKDGTYTVTHGTSQDTLSGVEQVQFTDTTMSINSAIEVRQHQEEVTRFYSALLGRNPDSDGLAYWVNSMASTTSGNTGISVQDVARSFSDSTEFKNMYGASVSNADFVNLLYQNILHRGADQAGYDFWLNTINQTSDRGNMIVEFSNSNEYVAQSAPTVDNYLSTVPLTNYTVA
ncbi:DUF4214 domain-containing protein [Sulfuricurvum sp.]|uniref:DUF4214 domain-containing protein n=1 Tax=Sulfuricurvum sp. TaxID=2025608 RepID=UPI003563725E